MGAFTSIEAIILAASALLGHGAAEADVAAILVEDKGVSSEMAWLAIRAAALL